MKVKEFVVKKDSGFCLKVLSWRCASPDNLIALNFIQESFKDGEVVQTSTYEFFLTDDEVQKLAQGLLQ